jgi:hypothetical protein
LSFVISCERKIGFWRKSILELPLFGSKKLSHLNPFEFSFSSTFLPLKIMSSKGKEIESPSHHFLQPISLPSEISSIDDLKPIFLHYNIKLPPSKDEESIFTTLQYNSLVTKVFKTSLLVPIFNLGLLGSNCQRT